MDLFPDAPKWKEKQASESEADIKSDRSPFNENIEDLVKKSTAQFEKKLHKKHQPKPDIRPEDVASS